MLFIIDILQKKLWGKILEYYEAQKAVILKTP